MGAKDSEMASLITIISFVWSLSIGLFLMFIHSSNFSLWIVMNLVADLNGVSLSLPKTMAATGWWATPTFKSISRISTTMPHSFLR